VESSFADRDHVSVNFRSGQGLYWILAFTDLNFVAMVGNYLSFSSLLWKMGRMGLLSAIKNINPIRCQWLTPVIPATQEAEMGRIMVPGQPRQKEKKNCVTPHLNSKKLVLVLCICRPTDGKKLKTGALPSG
jgi:hypothetical protein